VARKPKEDFDIISEDEIEAEEEISKEETFEDLLNVAAKIVVNTCMEIRRHESVLVIADPSTSKIGQELYKVCSEISPNVLLVIMPFTRHHGDEPPASVAELMRTQNVVLAPTKFSITHTKARVQACKDGARIATMPGITPELFAGGGMLADFNAIRGTISRVGVHLRRRRNIRVTSPEGTDIRFDVDPKKWNKEDSGICNRPGMVTNLPAGKIFNALIQGSAKGDLYIDGSFDSMVLSEPLRFKVNDGVATDIKGGPEAQRVRHLFAEAANLLPAKDQSSVWTISQFGIGLNPNSKLIGNALEDEKVLGSCYFSIGLEGSKIDSNHPGILTSGIIKEPTVFIDGEPLVISGELQI
jgi:leucyl aminopeptidase (aminopeptidase T)